MQVEMLHFPESHEVAISDNLASTYRLELYRS
jgi:hypothetical protein